jgi:hypothetical protein
MNNISENERLNLVVMTVGEGELKIRSLRERNRDGSMRRRGRERGKGMFRNQRRERAIGVGEIQMVKRLGVRNGWEWWMRKRGRGFSDASGVGCHSGVKK